MPMYTQVHVTVCTYIGIGVVLYCKLFTEEYDSGVYLVFIYDAPACLVALLRAPTLCSLRMGSAELVRTLVTVYV